jgi:DNA-binding CsgD family transcriptional regulator
MLLEREGDLDQVDALLERAAAGAGALLLVEGEAGTGKTSLLGALRRRASDTGFEVRAARGTQLEQPFAYGVARQLLEPVLADASPERRATLTTGAAHHAAVVLGEVGGEEAADSLRAHHGLHWLVVNLADEAPVALVCDDVHWADLPSLRWLCYLAHRAEALPVLIALGARPDASAEVSRILDELADDPLATLVRPRPLSEDAASELIRRFAGRDPARAFAATAHRVTRGNPFYLRELVRAAGDHDLPLSAEGADRLAELGPDRVARSVGRRVRQAGPAAGAVAHAVAVLDGPTPPAIVAEVADLPCEVVLREAQALIRGGVLSSGPELDYCHPIVRAAVAEHIDLADSTMLHARAAVALERSGEDPGRAAVHLLRLPARTRLAGAHPARILRDAAIGALARGESRTAIDWLSRALQEDLAPDEERELTLRLARAELRQRDPRAFARYEALMRTAPDAESRAELACELSMRLAYGGSFAESATLAAATLAAGGALPATQRLLEVQLTADQLLTGPLVPAGRAAAAALRPRLEAGEDLHPAEVGVVAQSAGLFGPRSELAVTRAAAAARDPRMAEIHNSGILGALAHGLMLADDRSGLELLFDATVHRGREQGDNAALIWSHTLRAQTRLSQGDATAAEADIEMALSLVPEDETAPAMAWILAVDLGVLTARGRGLEALERLEVRGPGEPYPPVYQFAALSLERGLALLAAGRYEAALEACLSAPGVVGDAPYSPEALPWRSAAALCRRALGDASDGRELAAAEVALAREHGGGRALGRALVAEGLCTGGDEQVARLRDAITVLEATDAMGTLAGARVELGAALRRGGHRTEAREALRRGLDGASRGGLSVLTARAREELSAAGARPRRERLDGVAALTASERRIVELAAAGATNRAIAQELFLTQKTVETHLSNAYRKLDIGSRTRLREALQAA